MEIVKDWLAKPATFLDYLLVVGVGFGLILLVVLPFLLSLPR